MPSPNTLYSPSEAIGIERWLVYADQSCQLWIVYPGGCACRPTPYNGYANALKELDRQKTFVAWMCFGNYIEKFFDINDD